VTLLRPSGHVWYAAYGSNLHPARFGCYIGGGRPLGSRRVYEGCRDRRLPERQAALRIRGRLSFGGRSRVWGGGMAFYDPTGDGEVLVRAYRIGVDQLADVVAQESRRPVGTLELAGGRDGHYAAPSSVYETVLHVGEQEGEPMLTLTSLRAPTPGPPSGDYLRTILAGLAEPDGFDLTPSEQVSYLLGAAGVAPTWSVDRLADLVAERHP
jgi:hypothetical protein